jgi:hypothetical protein
VADALRKIHPTAPLPSTIARLPKRRKAFVARWWRFLRAKLQDFAEGIAGGRPRF